ncbi:MAG: RepB family plasmid replication initiator protein, partial [Acetobacteraceae bacterium]
PVTVTVDSSKRLRTIDVEPDEYMLIKPGELIDIVELSPLTLQDRRIYNLLILNAWDSITEPKEHRIHKRDLRGSHNVNDRVGESLLRLMGAVAQLRIERDTGEGVGPERFTRRVQLLAGTEESARSDGIVYYSFPAAVRGIIKESSQYARLQKQVMFAFSSKYALALYEMVQKRGNMKFKTSEEFPLDRFRSLLGVDPGKLSEFKHFRNRAIDPAVLEVNGLGEFGCKVEPAYSGRKVTAVRLSWWAKNFEEHKLALTELRYSRVGRRARLKGEVVQIAPAPGLLPMPPSQDVAAPPIPGRDGGPVPQNARRPGGQGRQSATPTRPRMPPAGESGLTEQQMQRFRRDFSGLDIPWLEREFREWVAERDEPENYAAAFYGFMKKKQEQMNS